MMSVRSDACVMLRCCRYWVDNDNTPEQAGSDEPHRRPRGLYAESVC